LLRKSDVVFNIKNSQSQVMHAEALTDQVMKELRCASVSHVMTLAIDGWKNISRRHFQNVIAL